MIENPLLDELREIRRRLSEECQYDVYRYAEMLRQFARDNPGNYLDKPLPASREIPKGNSSGTSKSS